jgi:phosphomannomutase
VRIGCNDPSIIINVETRCATQLMPLKTAELLSLLQHFETALL